MLKSRRAARRRRHPDLSLVRITHMFFGLIDTPIFRSASGSMGTDLTKAGEIGDADEYALYALLSLAKEANL